MGDFGSTFEAVVIVLNRKLEDDLKKLGRQMQERFVLGIDLSTKKSHNLFLNQSIGQRQWRNSLQHICSIAWASVKLAFKDPGCLYI